MEILSQMWSLLGLLTVLQNVLPTQLLSLLQSVYDAVHDLLSPYSYFEVPEFNGYCGVDLNELYRHVNLYINSVVVSNTTTNNNPKNIGSNCRRLTLTRSKSSNRISFTVAPNHMVHDTFGAHSMSWTHHAETVQDSLEEKRSFTLRLPKRAGPGLLGPYLQFVTSRAEEFERVSRERRLYTNNGHGIGSYESGWVSVPFCHPSTFDTIALGPGLRKQITEDLTAFSNGKDFYHKVGRAWKRGYLLHGPPGSGKSSLIAAMANFLCYDVYDLELTKVADNSELRALLLQTTSRSVIVIEDIDCSVELTTDRLLKKTKKKMPSPTCSGSGRAGDEGETGRVTLSGLLNFTDGLWSCCGEERIIVFTTNHRDNVDPALVRCGRMDVHVNMGPCGAHAFRFLANNYLGLDSHPLFEVVENCIASGGALTPAQIGEILLRNRSDADEAMKEVVRSMQGRILSDHRNNEEAPKSPDSVLMMLRSSSSSDNDRGSTEKRKKRKVQLLVRLRSLTKSDSDRREL